MKQKIFSNKHGFYSPQDDLLKGHNVGIYDKIAKNFEKNNRTLTVQATGTGKSFLAMKTIKDFGYGKRVLFVAPTDVILDKFRENCVKHIPMVKMQLTTATYSGLSKYVNEPYDLIIFDEVHRSGAKTWQVSTRDMLSSHPNAMVLGMTATIERNDANIPEIFEVDGPVSVLSLVDAIEQRILPTPDYTLVKIDFSADKKYLEGAQERINETKAKVADKARKQVLDKLSEDIIVAEDLIKKTPRISTVFKQEFDKKPNLKNGKYIVFVEPGFIDGNSEYGEVNEKILEAIRKQAEKDWFYTPPTTFSVHSEYGKKHNDSEISSFEQCKKPGVKLLFSVNMLNEGLHVDDIDGVIMLRSTQSKTIYTQQLGRALSAGCKGKPKIFDFVANLDYTGTLEAISSDKKPSKKQTDTEFERERKQFNPVFDIDFVNYDEYQFVEQVKKNIITEFQRTDSKVVDEVIAQLKLYYQSDDYKNLSEKEKLYWAMQEYGIPSNYTMPSGFSLYTYLKKVLLGVNNPTAKGAIVPTEEQKERLRKLGFCFNDEDYNKKRVDIIISQLQLYYKSDDYLNLSEFEKLKLAMISTYGIPSKYTMPSGFSLYDYLVKITLGINSSNGRRAIVPTAEQKERLNKLGVCFTDNEYNEKRVDIIISQLQLYYQSDDYKNLSEKEKLYWAMQHYGIPGYYTMPSGFSLYEYLKKIFLGVNNPTAKGAIVPTEEQKERLRKLGFCFNDEDCNKKRGDIIISQLQLYYKSDDYKNLSEKDKLYWAMQEYGIPRNYKMPSGFYLYNYLRKVSLGVNTPIDKNALVPTPEQKEILHKKFGVCFSDEELSEKQAKLQKWQKKYPIKQNDKSI